MGTFVLCLIIAVLVICAADYIVEQIQREMGFRRCAKAQSKRQMDSELNK